MSLDVYLYEPGREDGDDELFWRNITHNLGKMASEAGIYQACWRPEELKISKACELVPLLRAGIARLVADPEHFKQWDASNGWGRYQHLLDFAREYLAACEANPTATIRVSR